MINPLYKDMTFDTEHANLDAWKLLSDLVNYAEQGTVYLRSVTPYDDDTFSVVLTVDVDCCQKITNWLNKQLCWTGNGTNVVTNIKTIDILIEETA